jgi:hypothetical protein
MCYGGVHLSFWGHQRLVLTTCLNDDNCIVEAVLLRWALGGGAVLMIGCCCLLLPDDLLFIARQAACM